MTAADDSHWEPDGVTLQVRFCEGRAVRSHVRRDYSPERAFFSAHRFCRRVRHHAAPCERAVLIRRMSATPFNVSQSKPLQS